MCTLSPDNMRDMTRITVVTVALLACQYAHGQTFRNTDALKMRPLLDPNDAYAAEIRPAASHHRRAIPGPGRVSGRRNNVIIRGRKRNSGQSRRVLGGHMVEPSKHPYLAAIVINDMLWCAGTIVHKRWVLTAAHCVSYVLLVDPPLALDYIKIRVGSEKALAGGATYNVTLAIRHPEYELEPPPHADVAMLKTTEDIEFGADVSPILIYEGVEEPYAQSFITTAGWGGKRGTLNAFKDKPTKLKEARLKVRTMEYCELAYQIVVGLTITEDFFCASLRNGTRDACLFDAGAPAVQGGMLVGVMSFGPESCGDQTMPSVFTRAEKFRKFVEQTICKYKIDQVEEIYTTVSVDSDSESGSSKDSAETDRSTDQPGDDDTDNDGVHQSGGGDASEGAEHYEANEEPAEANEEPEEANSEPPEANEKPAESDEAPTEDNEAPVEDNEEQPEDNEAPDEDNEAPEEPAENPPASDENGK